MNTLDDELLPPDRIEAHQREMLANMLHAIIPSNLFYQEKLSTVIGTKPGMGFRSAGFFDWPLTTRAELERDQADCPPYGTNLSFPLIDYTRLHQTSGSSGVPMRCLDRAEDWNWWKNLWATIYRAAGVHEKDIFLFPFSFGPFIGFWAAFESAAALGNLCLPAGGMTTKARLRFMLENNATIICCTPTYALRMAEVAAEENIDIKNSPIRALIVAGEPGGNIPATRERIESAWGARVFDHAGMTEMGAYAFECVEAPGGLHINEAEFIAEVIDPATLQAVAEGQTGELVLTNLGRIGMPLIRYRTGDLVRMLRGRCACGRHFARLDGGILGRIDDMVTIRGNNVFPTVIEAILRRFREVAEYRVVVDETGSQSDLRFEIEPAAGDHDGKKLCESVAESIRDRLNFRPEVSIATEPLPRFEMKSKRWIRRK